MNSQRLNDNIATLDRTLDRIIEMDVGISGDDTDYTLAYIATKLALVTTYCEQLSTYSTKLAKFSLTIVGGSQSAKALLKLRNVEFMNSAEYKSKPRGKQKPWLEEKMIPYTQKALHWNILETSLSVVQNAIAEKMSTFRRIDSALRLHTKIYEDRTGVGRGVPAEHLRGEQGGLPCEDI